MFKTRNHFIWPGLAACLLLTRCDCDFFGATGALFVSEQDEIALGSDFHNHLTMNDTAKQEYPVYKAETAEQLAFESYVIGLGKELEAAIPESDRPGYEFTFTIIDADVQNAFAVPGGFVYIYTGIIREMKDESELVGVLGHEIAHVTQHHYRDALAKTAGLGILIDALAGDDESKLTQVVAQSFGSLAALAVTRSNESESDEVGTKYCGSVGRNPLGIAKYFGRSMGQSFKWLSTHPPSEDRVEAVEEQVEKSSKLKALADDAATTNYTSRFLEKTAAIR
jgi:predicted Zn-dependent protease